MATPQRFNLNAIPGQIASLEQRITRIEASLNLVLERLSLPTIEKPAPVAPILIAAATVLPKPADELKSGPYTYKPLENGQIRVLMVNSSKDNAEPVTGKLFHVPLHDGIRAAAGLPIGSSMFRALSYTWGDLNKKGSIRIDGYEFPVTSNLETALRYVRNNTKTLSPALSRFPDRVVPSYWWVDAICINQEDILERNQQVALMTRIYKMSSGVQVWLGTEGDNSNLAMDLITQIANADKARSSRGPGEPPIEYPDLTLEQKVLHWNALTALFARPWWERCWIRQEVAVPRAVTVQCGGKTCSFDNMIAAADICNVLDVRLGYNGLIDSGSSATTMGSLRTSCYLRARQLSDLRSNVGGGHSAKFADLKELLFHTRSCKATDLRDKVFSVLGMADPDIYAIQPDYRIALKDAVLNVTRCVISKKQSLNILSGGQNPNRSHGLPSWAINMLDYWKCRPLWVDPGRSGYSEDFPDIPYFTFEGDDNTILRVKGRRLGPIATLVPETPKQEDSAEQLDGSYERWKAAAATELSKPNIEWNNGRFLKGLNGWKKDGLWVQLLSLGTDSGSDMKYSEDGLTLLPNKEGVHACQLRDPRIVESLLLPKDSNESAISTSLYIRIHGPLRQYGIGRKLCFLGNGATGLVPAETQVGDELCDFRRTAHPYVLRKLDDGKYVVVGEARKLTPGLF
jgi:hypothetical protein